LLTLRPDITVSARQSNQQMVFAKLQIEQRQRKWKDTTTRAGNGKHRSGQTRDLAASDAILLRVMWP
jgi:hypothetical protein